MMQVAGESGLCRAEPDQGGAWTEVVKNGRRKKTVQAQGEEEYELVEDLEQTSRQDMDRSLARLREERQKMSTPSRRVREERQGGWMCRDEMGAWKNSAWRQVCMKCKNERKGIIGKEQEGVKQGVSSGRMEYAMRHPKVTILSINLTKDGKTGQRPKGEDHIIIMRQTGLNLDEVRGKVGKNGYLEVAREPGSASAVGALREVRKKVDARYTVSGNKEPARRSRLGG